MPKAVFSLSIAIVFRRASLPNLTDELRVFDYNIGCVPAGELGLIVGTAALLISYAIGHNRRAIGGSVFTIEPTTAAVTTAVAATAAAVPIPL